MATINDKKTFARCVSKGIRAIADCTGKQVGEAETWLAIDSDAGGFLPVGVRALQTWQYLSSVPYSLDEDKLFGLAWMVLNYGEAKLKLHYGKPALDWLLDLLNATSIVVPDPPTQAWLRASLNQARVPGVPASADVDSVLRRLFPAEQPSPSAPTAERQPFPRTPPSPSAPFVGPVPFRTADSGVFFGRQRFVDALLRKIADENWPLLIVNGQSGVGKTSLLRAGVIPALQGRGYTPIYVSILDSPQSDVLRVLREGYPNVNDATDIADAVIRIGRGPDCPRCLVLLVDQMERCFTLARDSEEWMGFWTDMARLVRGDLTCAVKIVFAIRADWLHAFQQISPDAFDVPVFDFLFLITPLKAEEAREALIKPFERFDVDVAPDLADRVIQDLTTPEGHINPPELQIVGTALYSHLIEVHPTERQLVTDDYRALNGAHIIIRRHLSGTVNGLGPNAALGWNILLKLVGPRNERVEKRAEDLRDNLSPQQFEHIMGLLMNARLVMRELSTANSAPVFVLTHDFLVQEINQHFAADPSLQDLKTARNYLAIGLADWQDAKRVSARELLLDAERYHHIQSQKPRLGLLTDEAMEFMFRNGLRHADYGFGDWLTGSSSEFAQNTLQVAVGYCCSDDSTTRDAAQTAVVKALRKGTFPNQYEPYLKDLFWQKFSATSDSSPESESSRQIPDDQRQESRGQIAEILWLLRRYAGRPEMMKIVPVFVQSWMLAHRAQVFASVTALLLIVLSVGTYFLMRGADGRWQALETLAAGPVILASGDPIESDMLYAVTQRGRTGRDMATLFQRTPDGDWQELSTSFTNSTVTALLVTPSDGGQRIYAAISGSGVLRSDDSGQTWRSIVVGLKSYDIRSLIASLRFPGTMYAASGDQRGVFRSRDGGDSWEDISGDEMFAASVMSMTYSRQNGGTVIAGTFDGRIAAYNEADSSWKLRSSYPGIGGVSCLTAEPASGSNIFAGTSTGSILLSTNGGIDWIMLEPPPGIYGIASMSVLPGDPKSVYLDAYGIGGNVVWKSDDMGQHWQHIGDDRFTREPKRLIAFREVLYAASSAGLFSTRDGGDSWEYEVNIKAPLAHLARLAISRAPGGPIYASEGGSIHVTIDPGATEWLRGSGLPALAVRDIEPDPIEADLAYAGVYLPNKWSVFKTTNRGRNWQATQAPDGIPEKYLNDSVALGLAHFGEQRVLYVGTGGCGVLRSRDGGASWDTWGRRDCTLPDDTPRNVLSLVIDPRDSNTVYAAADHTGFYVTTNGGKDWDRFSLPLTAQITDLLVDQEIPTRLYLIAGSDGFWRSDDGGKTWRRLMAGLESRVPVAIAAIPGSSGSLALAAANGEVWRTKNGGEHWHLIRANLAVSGITTLVAIGSGGELLLAPVPGGLFRYEPGSVFVRPK